MCFGDDNPIANLISSSLDKIPAFESLVGRTVELDLWDCKGCREDMAQVGNLEEDVEIQEDIEGIVDKEGGILDKCQGRKGIQDCDNAGVGGNNHIWSWWTLSSNLD